MAPTRIQLPAPPTQRLNGVRYLQDFPRQVQEIACWVADYFARTALWPSQPAMWREMIQREISPLDVLRDGAFVFANFTNSPREGQFVALTSWALYDSARCTGTFRVAYTFYLDLERRLQDKDAIHVTHDDVAALTGLKVNSEELHRALWLLYGKYGGAWDYKSLESDWALDFAIGMTTFPRPTMEELFLQRLTDPVRGHESSGSIFDDIDFATATASTIKDLDERTLTDQFAIERKLGEGVYADVWLARDKTLDRNVALKIVRPDTQGAQNAMAHARALARVQHQNIVTVHQVIDRFRDPQTDKLVSAVVMEYVPGSILEEILHGPDLDRTQAREIGLGLVSAVTAYHSNGLAHTDLHDENVVVSDHTVKVIDPLYFETAAMQSTASRTSLQRRDNRNLRDLLGRLLRKTKSISQEALLDFAGLAEDSISELRIAFSGALDETPYSDTIHRPDNESAPSITTVSTQNDQSLRSLLADDRYELELLDRIKREVRRALDAISDDKLLCSGTVPPTLEELLKRVAYYEEIMAPLCIALSTGCYWGRPAHDKRWRYVVERLADRPPIGGIDVWIQLRRYPALLAMYAGGIAAAARPNYGAIKAFLIDATIERDGVITPLSRRLYPTAILNQSQGRAVLPGMAGNYTPISERLLEVLRPVVQPVLSDPDEYQDGFTRFEYFQSLVVAQFSIQEGESDPWLPLGRYAWHTATDRTIRQLEREVAVDATEWPGIKSGLFSSSGSFKGAAQILDKFVQRSGWRFR